MSDDTTSSAPTSGAADRPHLSLEELADLQAGELDAGHDDRETAARARHLDGCAACRAASDELGAVSTFLASVPEVAMPAEVTARIDAAIRAAATARAGEPTSTAGGSHTAADDRVVPIADARARRGARARRVAAASVGVAAVLGGGLLFGRLVLDSAGRGDSMTAGSSYSDADAGGAGELATEQSGGARADGAAPTESGTDYTATNLVPEVEQLIADVPVATSGSPAPAPMTSERPADPGARGLAGCVAAVSARADAVQTPVAVDLGSYEGTPAVVVVFAAEPGSAGAGEIWVADAACIGDRGALEVLTRQRLPLEPGTR